MKRRHFLCTSLLAVAGCTTATRTSTKQASTLKTISQPEKLRFAVSGLKVAKLHPNATQPLK